MFKKQGIICTICFILMSVLTGCGNARKREYTGNVVKCSYSYGSYFGGYYEYHLALSGEECTFTAMGFNGVALDVARTVDSAALLRLQEIIKAHSLHKWDGFYESDDDVLDGYSFDLSAEFDDGQTLSASGYMKYPKNYDDAHDALTAFFEELVQEKTP